MTTIQTHDPKTGEVIDGPQIRPFAELLTTLDHGAAHAEASRKTSSATSQARSRCRSWPVGHPPTPDPRSSPGRPAGGSGDGREAPPPDRRKPKWPSQTNYRPCSTR